MGRSGMRHNNRRQVFYDRRREDREIAPGGGSPLGCGKWCFSSRSEAKSAIRRRIGSGTMTDKDIMSFYRCDKCQAWHIGHDRKLREGARGTS